MNTSMTWKTARLRIKKGLDLIDEAAELNRARKGPEPSRRGEILHKELAEVNKISSTGYRSNTSLKMKFHRQE
jgi:hypothetical protein